MEQPLIYVIDDDKANNFLCRIMLKEAELENISSFYGGEAALEDLQKRIISGEELPTVILLDINMPRMDGWEFLDEYRQLPEWARAQMNVFFITTSDFQTDIEKARKYPEVIDFLDKPIPYDVACMLKEKYFRVAIRA